MIKGTFLQNLSNLLKTLSSPRILLNHMHTLRHSHITLLNTPYNKSRPPSALIEASNDYLVLQGTLREELPTFFKLYEQGLGAILLEFSKWQKGYCRELRDRWISFWIALAAEGENETGAINGIGTGADETVKIWHERVVEVEEILRNLDITVKKGPKTLSPPTEAPTSLYRRSNGSTTSVQDLGDPGVYGNAGPSLSAQDLPDSRGSDQRNSGNSTPARGRHKRNGSDNPGLLPPVEHGPALHTEMAQLMLGSLAAPAIPSMLPSSKREKSKGRDKEPRTPKNSKETGSVKNGRTRTDPIQVPRLVEPFGQDIGVGLPFAPLSPTKDRTRPTFRGKGKQSDDNDTISGSSTGGTGVFRRRLTDALFGLPRVSTNNKHGRSKSLNTDIQALPKAALNISGPIALMGKTASDEQLPVNGMSSKRSSLAPPPPLRPSSDNIRPTSPSQGPLDGPPPSPLYACTAIVPFLPPTNTTYMSLPFLTLHVGDLVQVLFEAGHPAEHHLPFYVDDGNDTLLVVRDEDRKAVGWAFASFLLPLT